MTVIPRSYQEGAVVWLSRKKRGIVKSPAASGKTLIAAFAIQRVLAAKTRDRKVRVGWMANTEEQCGQAYKALLLVFFGIQAETHDAESKWNDVSMSAPFVLNVQCAQANTDWSSFDLLIVDEAHHLGTASQWQSQVSKCNGAVWGFTATPPEILEAYQVFMSFFDGNEFVVGRSEVTGSIVEARVKMLSDSDEGLEELIDAEIEMEMKRRMRWWKREETNLIYQQLSEKEISESRKAALLAQLENIKGELWGMCAWQICVNFGMVNNGARNEAIIQRAFEHSSEHVLVLVNSIEHGEALSKRIPTSIACSSKMGKKKRQAAMQDFTSGKCRCLIATSLADEGLDLPVANVLVLGGGGRSNARNEQRTGRVLRNFVDKTHGMIYDFRDLFHPLAAKHARKRLELYRRLKYKIL